jgi:uncharacterized protein (UPF0335 family)
MIEMKSKGNGSPERQFFERAVRLESEISDLRTDLKALWDEAKRDPQMDAQAIRSLKRAVKISLEPDGRRKRREQAEISAYELLQRLGHNYSATPLGNAAMAAAGARYDPETGEIRE